MPVSYHSLLPGGAGGWHDGTGAISYSFLGGALPAYYPLIDTNSDTVPDAYAMLDGAVAPVVPQGADVAMTAAERAMAEQAVAAWNEVANIHLAPVQPAETTGSPITGDGTLVRGLGGTTGFGEAALPRGDDTSMLLDISAVFENGLNFYGTQASALYVNTNGSVSFSQPVGTFTPTTLSTGAFDLIAPFWADVDTRPDGIGPESQPVYLDIDPVADVVTITWNDVGYYDHHADLLNRFQLQLFDRGGGDFDIVFRYEAINWVSGDASGGTGGLGGAAAQAGFSSVNGDAIVELAQSGDQAAMLALDQTPGNTGTIGLWAYQVRRTPVIGDITFASYPFSRASGVPDTNLFGFVTAFPDSVVNGAKAQTGTPSRHGDIWINTGNPDQNVNEPGHTSWNTYLHELGHALGLHHPDEGPANSGGLADRSNKYTVMSYVPHPAAADYSRAEMPWPLTPMVYDIQAAQALYGANMTTRAGDTTYFGPGYGGDLAYQYAGAGMRVAGRPVILTIWDAGGIDLIDASTVIGPATIDLRPGAFSTIGPLADNIAMSAAVLVGGRTINFIENATGTEQADTITGNATENVLTGRRGADHLFGLEGNDTLNGGGGADVLSGGSGRDMADYVTATGAVAVDLLNPASNTGEAAGDTYASIEDLRGSRFGDDLRGDNLVNLINGGTGNDFIMGRGGDDVILGGAGNDILVGGDGADVLNGGTGNDRLVGNSGNDRMLGDDGDDVLVAIGGNNTLFGGAGSDTIYDGNGSSSLFGGTGADRLIGSGGNDLLSGGWGNDTLNAGAGNDRLSGDEGNDFLVGGTGTDTFIFRANMGWDRINDYEIGIDRLYISEVLTGGITDAATVISAFADWTNDDLVFDFGAGNLISLLGLSTMVGLDDGVLITL